MDKNDPSVKSAVENPAIGISYGSVMEVRQLEIFASVVKVGSLTAAAALCRLSQPAISQQIQALEDELGETLLIRRPRGVKPTAAGVAVLEHAVVLLAGRDRLRDAFTGRRQLQTGRVAFGIIPTIAPYLLPQWLGPFRSRFPAITIAISESRTDELIAQLVDGRIEFAVLSDVTEQERKKWSLHVRELFREPLLLAAPVDHPLAIRKNPPTPADLKPQELIHLKGGHCLAERMLRLCKIREPDPGLQCDQLETAMSMVASGLGVTVVPKLAIRDRIPEGIVLRDFAGSGLDRGIALMKRRGSRESPAAEELLKWFSI
jgi:LysR family hydrogen peroxide-inducible transcriptional activator